MNEKYYLVIGCEPKYTIRTKLYDLGYSIEGFQTLETTSYTLHVVDEETGEPSDFSFRNNPWCNPGDEITIRADMENTGFYVIDSNITQTRLIEAHRRQR